MVREGDDEYKPRGKKEKKRSDKEPKEPKKKEMQPLKLQDASRPPSGEEVPSILGGSLQTRDIGVLVIHLSWSAVFRQMADAALEAASIGV